MTPITQIATIAELPRDVDYRGPLAVPTLAAAQAFADELGYAGGWWVESNKQAYFMEKEPA